MLTWATLPWPIALTSTAQAQSSPPAERRFPSPDAVKLALADAYRTGSAVTAGKNADYIPYLAKVPFSALRDFGNVHGWERTGGG